MEALIFKERSFSENPNQAVWHARFIRTATVEERGAVGGEGYTLQATIKEGGVRGRRLGALAGEG